MAEGEVTPTEVEIKTTTTDSGVLVESEEKHNTDEVTAAIPIPNDSGVSNLGSEDTPNNENMNSIIIKEPELDDTDGVEKEAGNSNHHSEEYSNNDVKGSKEEILEENESWGDLCERMEETEVVVGDHGEDHTNDGEGSKEEILGENEALVDSSQQKEEAEVVDGDHGEDHTNDGKGPKEGIEGIEALVDSSQQKEEAEVVVSERKENYTNEGEVSKEDILQENEALVDLSKGKEETEVVVSEREDHTNDGEGSEVILKENEPLVDSSQQKEETEVVVSDREKDHTNDDEGSKEVILKESEAFVDLSRPKEGTHAAIVVDQEQEQSNGIETSKEIFPANDPLDQKRETEVEIPNVEEESEESLDDSDSVDIQPGRRRRVGETDEENFSDNSAGKGDSSSSYYSDANEESPSGNLDAPRGSGDGEEERKEREELERSNPMYVPKTGRFYMHDRRDNDEEKEEPSKQPERERRRGIDSDRWGHDKYNVHEQTPLTRDHLVRKYGRADMEKHDRQYKRTDDGQRQNEPRGRGRGRGRHHPSQNPPRGPPGGQGPSRNPPRVPSAGQDTYRGPQHGGPPTGQGSSQNPPRGPAGGQGPSQNTPRVPFTGQGHYRDPQKYEPPTGQGSSRNPQRGPSTGQGHYRDSQHDETHNGEDSLRKSPRGPSGGRGHYQDPQRGPRNDGPYRDPERGPRNDQGPYRGSQRGPRNDQVPYRDPQHGGPPAQQGPSRNPSRGAQASQSYRGSHDNPPCYGRGRSRGRGNPNPAPFRDDARDIIESRRAIRGRRSQEEPEWAGPSSPVNNPIEDMPPLGESPPMRNADRRRGGRAFTGTFEVRNSNLRRGGAGLEEMPPRFNVTRSGGGETAPSGPKRYSTARREPPPEPTNPPSGQFPLSEPVQGEFNPLQFFPATDPSMYTQQLALMQQQYPSMFYPTPPQVIYPPDQQHLMPRPKVPLEVIDPNIDSQGGAGSAH